MSESESTDTETPDTTGTDTTDSDTTDSDTAATDTADSTESSETDEPTDASESKEPTDAPDKGSADSTEATTGPDPRLLEELDEHIRGARAAAEDALGGVEHTFVESGDGKAEDEDDQTIAPPG